ncbi:MAG: LytTR family transcriptional regulator DNA-binding domain-containing protein [Psychroserpens sp.]|uniref:LytTR family transcriptional regulator DNA-binding domain-containing protein n=1 Tax=Psychroserpens sp. TaxID=2020870 RepID=UPI0030036F25
MKKILVLPYHVNKAFKDAEYLSEGILEELIFLISSVSGLSTTSRSTSLYLNDNPAPHNDIKMRFAVDYVLEGSITIKEGQPLLISQLYDASNETLVLISKNEFHLEKWTHALDLLAQDISEAILGANTIFKTLDEDQSQAREYYQQGLYHWNRFTHEEMQLGISFFKKANRENPNFARAYAALADCYGIIGAMGYDNPKNAFKHAKIAVGKALKLNNKRSESYVSAAFINIFHEHDFEKAKANLDQALRLNKNSVKAHHFSAMYYIHISDIQSAEKHSLHSIKLDALALPQYAMITRICIYQRRFKDALDYIDMGLNIYPDAIPLIELRGSTNLLSGNLESAIEDFKVCINADNQDPKYYANLGYAYAKIGFFEESRAIENKIYALEINKDTGFFDYALAIIKLGQSDIKGFLKHIEKSAAYGIGFIFGELLNNPMFSEIKKNPRVQDLLIKFNHLGSKVLTKVKRPSSMITIVSHTNESLALDPQDISFIEANDNYCTVYWQNTGVLSKQMLRTTLKNIELQLQSYPDIVRCHKSYIINLNEDMQISGNVREAYFESTYLPIRIPISRSKKGSIETRFEALNRDI